MHCLLFSSLTQIVALSFELVGSITKALFSSSREFLQSLPGSSHPLQNIFDIDDETFMLVSEHGLTAKTQLVGF